VNASPPPRPFPPAAEPHVAAARRAGWGTFHRVAVLAHVVGLLAVLAPVTVPGAAERAAAAAPCRTEVTGEPLPENAGPYPLIDQLGLRQAWDLSTGYDVRVAVIDSGIDSRHPDLVMHILPDASTYTVVPDEREFVRTTPMPEQDCLGHGTAVAGLIVGERTEGDRMAGVAPDAYIYTVRSADGIERATPAMLAAMLDDAVYYGARVINLSLAIPVDREPIREAVANAVANDVVVVAAAGNEGNAGVSQGKMYPAAYDGVVAVGAVGNDGQPLDSSNAGPWVDLASYGEDLVVAAPGGSGYRVESGTSFAAAQVSGVAALVRARFPDMPATEVVRRMIDSATAVGGGRNDRTGAGIVDPFGALTDLGGGGHGDGDGDGAPASDIPVQAMPESLPLLSGSAATALAWSGGLVLAVVLGLAASPAIRRAARRGWRTGPDAPDGSRKPPPTGPRPRLGWLDGTTDRPDPPPRHTSPFSPSSPSSPLPRTRTHRS
jgi:type VII secretion-associated serine protease mycosin